jgi:hypothetical protein
MSGPTGAEEAKADGTRMIYPNRLAWLTVLILVADLCCPWGPWGEAIAGKLFSASETNARAVPLGSPETPYQASLIIKLPVAMKKGEIANFVAEAEGSIYSFSKLPDFVLLEYAMFQTSTVLVFKPGPAPPELTPVAAKDHVWQIDTKAIGATQVCPSFGRDIGRDRDYYYPVTRAGAFKAPEQGNYIFALYMWGGSTAAKPGDVAMVYPGTAQLTVTVH